jgi:8-oxo-dGTP pyrophosphatase MutT (NUDIX family)
MQYPIRVRASALIIRDHAVLLVEFDDKEIGLHYNLPAGGVEPGESITRAVQREAREEAAVQVEVGPLAFVYEYEPHLNAFKYGPVHTLDMIFDCKLADQASPRLPDKPDLYQTAVKWVNLSELASVNLLPKIAIQIIQYAANREGGIFVEEHTQLTSPEAEFQLLAR